MNLMQRALRRLIGQRDYLDGIRDGVLHGWALPKRGAGPVPVALYAGQSRLAETLAGQFRADLRDAGLAGGACGFSFGIETETGVLRVCRLDGPRPVEIGRIRVDAGACLPPVLRLPRAALVQDTLGPGLAALRAAPLPARSGMARLSPRQARLFDPVDPGTRSDLPDPLFAWMAYLGSDAGGGRILR